MTLKEAKDEIYSQIEADQKDPELLAFTYGQLARVRGYVAVALLEALTYDPKEMKERQDG